MNERKKEVLMSFKSPIRPNKSIHLEMLSHLGEEQQKKTRKKHNIYNMRDILRIQSQHVVQPEP